MQRPRPEGRLESSGWSGAHLQPSRAWSAHWAPPRRPRTVALPPELVLGDSLHPPPTPPPGAGSWHLEEMGHQERDLRGRGRGRAACSLTRSPTRPFRLPLRWVRAQAAPEPWGAPLGGGLVSGVP